MTAASTEQVQTPFDAAVVIPTLLRPSLLRAVRSVFAQDLAGRVQILVGIDIAEGDHAVLENLRQECPGHMHLMILDPGYSTSIRHGGLYSNRYSGALRTILTYLANSRYVAYLDDDNFLAPEHLSSLLKAIDGVDWAYSWRWFVAPGDGTPLCIDDWESVGPGAGVYLEQFGGFADPSTLMIDKLACHDVAPLWAIGPFQDGGGEDRVVFENLRTRYRGAATERATCYYQMHERDAMHLQRVQKMRERGITLPDTQGVEIRPLLRAAEGFELAANPARAPAPAIRAGNDPVLGPTIAQLKPSEIIVFGAVEPAVTMAAQARAVGLAPMILMVDVPVPIPPVAAALIPHLAILPPESGDSCDWLLGAGIAVDLVYIAAQRGTMAQVFQTAWAVTRPGGIIVIDPNGAPKQELTEAAATVGATLHPVSVSGPLRWLVSKDH